MTWSTIGEHRLWQGDCIDALRSLPDCSVDACVTDPPYGLGKPPRARDVLSAWLQGERAQVSGGGFMGREWDAFVPGPRIWSEVLRVLKPGGHLVCFAGQRTAHWMGIALELAGFESRDLGAWLQWQGFPKSLDVSKAADDKHWEGWGTALKPAAEPWILARKPLSGTVVETVREWGTGALNIDACRYGYGDPAWPGPSDRASAEADHASVVGLASRRTCVAYNTHDAPRTNGFNPDGRWPANVYHCPKASGGERELYCEGLETARSVDVTGREAGAPGHENPRSGARWGGERRNTHPTVKPLRLMRWLCRLVTPPGGVVLDPFLGSGTTALVAHLEGLEALGAEQDPDHYRLASTRLRNATATGADAARLTATDRQPSLWGSR